MLEIKENATHKVAQAEDYHYLFDKKTGFFARWGKTLEDDPDFSAYGPEILDIEITTICNGIASAKGIQAPCKFCYKGNTKVGRNMSYETFCKVIDSMGTQLTQMAFGADAQATSNPDIWRMMEYARSKGVVPNITVADIDDDVADKLIKYCGAVAVSRYANKDICYNSVKKLSDRGLKQVNIHMLVSQETYATCLETINDRLTDPRLAGLNAIVFLSLKQKGRGVSYTPLSPEQFQVLVKTAMSSNVNLGFDSCSCFKFLSAVSDHPDFETFQTVSEPCEATLFSSYVNVDGNYFPCSFAEGLFAGLPVGDRPFMEVWNDPTTKEFREKLLATAKQNGMGCRECPLFKI